MKGPQDEKVPGFILMGPAEGRGRPCNGDCIVTHAAISRSLSEVS
jgi:hypothetical protein